MNRCLCCCFAILLLAASLSISRAQTAPQPMELIQAANAASDLSGIGPYRLDATIIVNRGTNGEQRGRLTIFQDHEKARSELEWSNYKQLDVVLGNKLYVVRNGEVRVRYLLELFDVRKPWRAYLSDNLGQPFTMDLQGITANCVALQLEYEFHRYCFDPSTKVLIENAWTKPNKPKDSIEQMQYLDYRQIEGRYFPSAIRYFSPKKAVHQHGPELENIHITRAQLDPALFSIPTNAREFETCEDMQAPRLTTKEEPRYPEMAKIAHIQGEVYIAAIIGNEGNLEDVRPVSGHPILIQAALDAIKKWHYSPAMCGTNPVAVETELRVEFRIG
jgi:TonB family protein